jgi:predicted RNase H-like HicB family nuclease
MKVQVCLKVGPMAAGAFVPDYPGFWVFGRDQKSALDKVKTAVQEWHTWVRAHGENVESPSATSV